MSATERMQRLLVANPAQLARIDAILDGSDTSPIARDEENRLVTFTDAARRLNASRSTVYQLTRTGQLEVVPLNGVNRITLRSVNELASGKSHAGKYEYRAPGCRRENRN